MRRYFRNLNKISAGARFQEENMFESMLNIIFPNELNCLIGVHGSQIRLALRHRTAGDQERGDAEKSASVRIE